MKETTEEPPNLPERDGARADHDQLPEEQVLSRETLPEGVEHLGDGYTNLDDYLRAELEEHVAAPIRWILQHLDMRAIRSQFEAGRYMYLCESGSVYRVTLPEAHGPDAQDRPQRE